MKISCFHLRDPIRSPVFPPAPRCRILQNTLIDILFLRRTGTFSNFIWELDDCGINVTSYPDALEPV